MAEHILKTVEIAWDAIANGAKKFEIRKNDRFFQQGDIVVLRKIDADGHFTPKDHVRWSTCDLRFRIGWMLQGGQFGLAPGYCAFTLEPLEAVD